MLLLQNTVKPDRRQEMGVSLGVDLSGLGACFGGFSPTVMGDATQSIESARQSEERIKARQEALERADQIERARASAPREWESPSGSLWRYVVLDDAEIRIERCLRAVSLLEVPSEIEGKPVVALADDACAYLDEVEDVRLPDSVLSVGFCAFRECRALKHIEFPAGLAKFDSDWLRGCHKLQHLRLPGQWEKITPAVFDSPALKCLEIGAGTAAIMPGAFAKSVLESVSISPDNPLLWTDGTAVYSTDRSILLALAVPTEEYTVAAGCRAIAKKGLSGFGLLRCVNLPDSLEVLGDFAYAKTAVSSFVAPASLRTIGERAFFGCADLESVALNEGLASIANNAFSDTAIQELRIPASVEEIGNPLAAKTALTYSGAEATFSIAENSTHLKLDEAGALYRVTEDGLCLVRMMEPAAEEYTVNEACNAIGEDAFLKHAFLRRVVLPEELRTIGARAFRDCRMLTVVNLPTSVEEIGEEAFLGTNIQALHIPASVRRIGALALITEGAHHGSIEPSLRNVTVDAGNGRYRMESGLLIERLDAGYDRVLLCTGAVHDVVVPDTVKAVAAYAFSGVRTVRTIALSDRITMVEARGLAFDSLAEHIYVAFEKPIEGHDAIDLEFPNTTRAAQQMMLAFSVPAFVNVAEILSHYDNSILNASGFDAETEENLKPYDQVTRIIARLKDPLLMTPANRSLADKVMRSHFKDFCVALARHDDKEGMEALLELGYMNVDNIADAIEYVAPIQDASVTNFLLEAKQRRFGKAAIDFDLDFEL